MPRPTQQPRSRPFSFAGAMVDGFKGRKLLLRYRSGRLALVGGQGDFWGT